MWHIRTKLNLFWENDQGFTISDFPLIFFKCKLHTCVNRRRDMCWYSRLPPLIESPLGCAFPLTGVLDSLPFLHPERGGDLVHQKSQVVDVKIEDRDEKTILQ